MFDLEFVHVSKRYRIATAEEATNAPLDRIRRMLRKPGEFWALKDVSFAIRPGEAVGVIGHNGAGKSTALKLFSNITTPTGGEIRIHGRIAALLEVGSGFHPELTGRENIFLSGSILGMKRKEIAANLDRILDFAGLQTFADTPVKRYSSGMYVRLGFAIAAHLEADILLLDEVLAVGDAQFHARCQQRIGELKAAGKTIVFISHDLASIRQLCNRVLLLDHGQLIGDGDPDKMIERYSSLGHAPRRRPAGGALWGAAWLRVTSIFFLNEHGERTTELRTGFPVRACVEIEVNEPADSSTISLLFSSAVEQRVVSQFSTTGIPLQLKPGRNTIEFQSAELSLGPGIYSAGCTLSTDAGETDLEAALHFAVAPGRPMRGQFYSPNEWKLV